MRWVGLSADEVRDESDSVRRPPRPRFRFGRSPHKWGTNERVQPRRIGLATSRIIATRPRKMKSPITVAATGMSFLIFA